MAQTCLRLFAARMKRKAAASRGSPDSRQLTANSSEKNIGGGHEPPHFVFRNHQQTIEGTLRLMPDKKHILNSIAAVAKQLGHAPSRAEFISRCNPSPAGVRQFGLRDSARIP